MPIRKILVPVQGTDTDISTLSAALSVAKTFGAQAQALFVRPDPSEALPYLGDGVSGQVIEDLLQAAKEGSDAAAARAKKTLEEAAAKAGIPVVSDTATLPSARFTQSTGRQDLVVAEESRLSDVVLFGGAELEDGAAGGDALEAALLSADRPVLIAPKNAAKTLGKSVVIGWDGSLEASAAVTASIPFIAQADKVTILCIDDGDNDGTPNTVLETYLALHGASAETHTVKSGGRPVGEVLLEEASAAGADLLVMGGYGHSRLREFLFGGATQHVRAHTSVAVLMAH
ncbi:MAG: universal stress protein [Parvibaculaceae bacterium]